MRKQVLLIFIAVVLSALLLAGCTQPGGVQPTIQPTQPPVTATVTPADTIRLANTTLGSVLTDAKGNTLYYFGRDIPSSGNSFCTGGCAAIWPAFSAGTIVVSGSLKPTDFAAFNRSDGSMQVSYKGWPLYYFKNDTKPGDMNGEGFGRIWFVAKPDYTVVVSQQGTNGMYLADSSGKTLYFFAKDSTGSSTCTGGCAALWPAFSPARVVVPSFVKVSDFTRINRSDGAQQLAYMGKPLYYYANDTKPGTTNGQGYNNLWYVANITGTIPVPVTTVPTTTIPTTPPPSAYSSSGGGSGY